MTLNAKPSMDVVRREDKEDRLKAFISNYLMANGDVDGGQTWLLIARSVDSPVVLAVSALAPAIKAAGYSIKTLLTHALPSIPDTAARTSIGFACELRIARDLRLLDAHEQLHIDASTSWIGDCMRREPAKRDAYECYATGCVKTAAWSARAFDRLWPRGEPMLIGVAEAVAAAVPVPDIDACVSQATQIPSTVVVSTRH